MILDQVTQTLQRIGEHNLAGTLTKKSKSWQQKYPSSQTRSQHLQKTMQKLAQKIQPGKKILQQIRQFLDQQKMTSDTLMSDRKIAQKLHKLSKSQQQQLFRKLFAKKYSKEYQNYLTSLKKALQEESKQKTSQILSQIRQKNREYLAGLKKSRKLLQKLALQAGWGGKTKSSDQNLKHNFSGTSFKETKNQNSMVAATIKKIRTNIPETHNKTNSTVTHKTSQGYLKKAWWPPQYQKMISQYYNHH